MKILCICLSIYEKGYCQKHGFPEATLRYRVNGTPDLEGFLAEGERCSRDLEDALTRIGRRMDSFQSILDFGCGCGRTIRWFEKYSTAIFISGTDIDSAAIFFCRKHLKEMNFAINQALPPLEYSTAQFDLVYSISVFTHLDEDFQRLWLAELARIVKPGGVVLLSVHGSQSWNTLPLELVAKIHANGFLFASEHIWKGIFPDWYQTAFHTEKYVKDVFSQYFNVIEYVPKGVSDFQDLVIMGKQ